MRILLLEPKYGYKEAMPWIPIGKGYLAAILREHGFEVNIIDNALNVYDDRTLAKHIEDFSPDIVGTGGMTLQINDTKRIASLVKNLDDDILLVGGGVHLTLIPEDGLDLFDFIVIGEGEHTLLELCKRYKDLSKSKDKRLYTDIPGLCIKLDNIGTIITKNRDFIIDLDCLPLPAYDLLEVDKYHDFLITGERAASVMTGRGCPFDCEFCASPALSRRKVRYFSIDYTLNTIEYLKKKYGFENFRIMDDTFVLSKKRVDDFCKEINKKDLKINMTCLTHIRTADAEMFKNMKKAGFSIIALGIESGNETVLKLINKGITRESAARAIRFATEAGLMVEGLFMIGNMGETRETIEDSIKFAKEHNQPFKGLKRTGYNWFQFATPFPGSRFFLKAKEYGEVISFDYDNYSHQIPVFIPKGLDFDTMIMLKDKALRETNKDTNWLQKIFARFTNIQT